jgi:hypothetical protein
VQARRHEDELHATATRLAAKCVQQLCACVNGGEWLRWLEAFGPRPSELAPGRTSPPSRRLYASFAAHLLSLQRSHALAPPGARPASENPPNPPTLRAGERGDELPERALAALMQTWLLAMCEARVSGVCVALTLRLLHTAPARALLGPALLPLPVAGRTATAIANASVSVSAVIRCSRPGWQRPRRPRSHTTEPWRETRSGCACGARSCRRHAPRAVRHPRCAHSSGC